LSQKQIPYQIYETKGYMDAWKIAETISADDTSALIAVGGDGTLHEVVNGMMFRRDKRRIPIAFVPNGSGNDTCKSLGIQSID
jgi:diacylglycerol kinase family enzyme